MQAQECSGSRGPFEHPGHGTASGNTYPERPSWEIATAMGSAMKSVPGNVLPTSHGFPGRGKHPPKQKILLFFWRCGSICYPKNIFALCTSAPALQGLGELQQILVGWILDIARWRRAHPKKRGASGTKDPTGTVAIPLPLGSLSSFHGAGVSRLITRCITLTATPHLRAMVACVGVSDALLGSSTSAARGLPRPSSSAVVAGIQKKTRIHKIFPSHQPNIPSAKCMTSLHYQLSVETTHNARG